MTENSSQKRVCRVAAYVLVPSDTYEMRMSVTDPVSYYQSYIQRNPEWKFCGVYSDKVFSWNKSSREGFEALMEACRAGELDMVVTDDITSIIRNTSSLLGTLQDLKELGVDVYFEKEDIHSTSERGERFLSLFVSIAQEESRNVSMLMT